MSYDSAIVLLGIYPEERKTCSYKNLYKNIHSSFIHISPKQKTIQTSYSGQEVEQTVL